MPTLKGSAIYIAATIVYVFCILLIVTSAASILPDIDKIIIKNFNMVKNSQTNQYYKASTNTDFAYYFSYEIAKRQKNPFLMASNKSFEYHSIIGQIIFDDYVQPTFSQNFKKVLEEYDYLIITPEVVDNKIVVKMTNKLGYLETASAKYVISLIVSMINVAEQLKTQNTENYNDME